MRFHRTNRFDTNYSKLDLHSQKAIKKALTFLAADLKSLRTRKMEGTDYIFEVSANMDIRITFQYEQSDIIILRNCGHHDRTLNNP